MFTFFGLLSCLVVIAKENETTCKHDLHVDSKV